MQETHVEARKTSLYNWHLAAGYNGNVFGLEHAALVFVRSSGEHQIVITNAGIFDTSHMSVVTVNGALSCDLLQLCFTKDLIGAWAKTQPP